MTPPLLVCGDASVEIGQLGWFDLVVTDPPYTTSTTSLATKKATVSVAFALRAAASAVKKGGAMLVVSAASASGIDFMREAVEPVLPFKRMLVWHRQMVNQVIVGPWQWDITPVLCFGKVNFGRPQFSSMKSTNHQEQPSRRHCNHPVSVPYSVGRWLLAPWADQAPLRVLDPFCGGGSLLVAAQEQGHDVVGIDINPDYISLTKAALGQCSILTENKP